MHSFTACVDLLVATGAIVLGESAGVIPSEVMVPTRSPYCDIVTVVD